MQDLKTAILLVVIFTLLCGGLYPLVVTGVAQGLFPRQAGGSFVADGSGRVVGSLLIGQSFDEAKYFWPRPSATSDFRYNPLASGGSNAGPTRPAYLETVGGRVERLRAAGIAGPVPADLVQASASGLDPHISPEAARLQIPRVAKARKMAVESLAQQVAQATEGPQLGLFGAARVNVLALNLALDHGAP